MEKQVLQILRRGYQIFFPKKSKDFFTKKKPDLSKEKATAAIISLLKSKMNTSVIGSFTLLNVGRNPIFATPKYLLLL